MCDFENGFLNFGGFVEGTRKEALDKDRIRIRIRIRFIMVTSTYIYIDRKNICSQSTRMVTKKLTKIFVKNFFESRNGSHSQQLKLGAHLTTSF